METLKPIIFIVICFFVGLGVWWLRNRSSIPGIGKNNRTKKGAKK